MTPAGDAPPVEWVALPSGAPFALPLADTRSAVSSATLRSTATSLAVDAVIATEFPVVSLTGPWGTLSAGVEAGAFMQFGAGGELTFDLYTFDGLVGVPVAWGLGPWSARLAWAHYSAHYGDGIRQGDTRPTNLDAWSREQVEVRVARALGPARVYAGGRVLLHALPAAAPVGLAVGAEVMGPWVVAPYAAVDVQAAQEADWAPAIAAHLGGAWRGAGGRLRLAGVYRRGPEDTGKLFGTTEHYGGLQIGFDRGPPKAVAVGGPPRVQSSK